MTEAAVTASGPAIRAAIRPVTFAHCLGWLHLPPAGRMRDRGVVLCAPIGHERLAAYRSLYDLAERCAALGLPTLRFDYPGGGDSPGDAGPGQFEACRAALAEAGDWLRRHTGVAELAACGMQLGALLAAQVVQSQPGRFAHLALLAPVASGRTHVRQLWLAAQTGHGDATTTPEGRLEACGEVFHRRDLDALAACELEDLLRKAEPHRLLLLERKPKLATQLRDLGAVTALQFEDANGFFTHPHLARLPSRDFGRVADWLAEGAAPAPDPASLPEAQDLLTGTGLTERVLRFGPEGRLTGILCLPRGTAGRRLGALLLNTGANPRAGVGRLGVRMARRLAELGFVSLRIDAAGVGDSDPLPGATDPAAPPDMFDDAVIADAQAGLDALAGQGETRCLVIGVCAGAHTAFQLARRDPRVAGVAMFNLPAFDRAAGGAPALDGGPPPGESPLMRRPRMLLRRLRATCDGAIAAALGVESGLDSAGRWMRGITRRGTRVLLAYSARDRGLRELRAHFGRGGHQLARLKTVRRVVLDGTDHSLAPRAMQDQVLCLVEREALLLNLAALPARDAAMAAGLTDGPQPLPPDLMPAR